MNNFAQTLATFAAETRYEDLPPEVAQEAKRLLLDSIGCALGALSLEKAKMTVAAAKRLGGQGEASIIGTDARASLFSAVFANGELINCLDFDALSTPGVGHAAPYVIPAALALAEDTDASGKELIAAHALAYEIAARVHRPILPFYRREAGEGAPMKIADRHGHAACSFGAAAGAGKILKLNKGTMLHALGIAGHLCQVPTDMRFFFAPARPMAKYGSPGWQSTGAIIAALLAEMGYTGDTTVLDPEHGFFEFVGLEAIDLRRMTEDLGQTWDLLDVSYKPYPCCRALHTVLDCFYHIIDQHGLMSDEIDSITAFRSGVAFPAFVNPDLCTAVDAQFNLAYVLSVAAHRVPIGPRWQDASTFQDERVRRFMNKVKSQSSAGSGKQNHDLAVGRGSSAVEVVARGKTFREERTQAKGSPSQELRLTDHQLAEKFRGNASRVLTPSKIDKAIEMLMQLEDVESISELTPCVTL